VEKGFLYCEYAIDEPATIDSGAVNCRGKKLYE
jgi:hypothetical protein